MVNKAVLLVLLFTSIIFSTNSFADSHDGGPIKISSIRVNSGYFKVQFDPAPTGCGGGSDYGMHANIDNTSAYGKELISAVLTAYTAGIQLSGIWYSEATSCSNGNSLNLFAVQYEAK